MPPKKSEFYKSVKTDTQWETLLASTSCLLVVDIFPEWCGVCKAVQSIFRRYKHEHAENIQFAAAQFDTISALAQYRNRCRPVFHIYGQGKLVGVVHGANGFLLEEMIHQLLVQAEAVEKGESSWNEIEDTEILDMKIKESKSKIEVREVGLAEVVENDESQYNIDGDVTIAVIKPDIVQSGKGEEVLSHIREQGILIVAQKELTLTVETVKELYAHLSDQPQFEDLVAFMISGPSICLGLKKSDLSEIGIVEAFRKIIGPCDAELARKEAPDSIRAKYGTDTLQNAIHGSSSIEQAARELAFCFPELAFHKQEETTCNNCANIQRTLALIQPDALNTSINEIYERIKMSGFEIAYAKEVTISSKMIEEFYSSPSAVTSDNEAGLENNEIPRMKSYLIKCMSDKPLLALCLCRTGAVSGWLDMISKKTKVEEETDTISDDGKKLERKPSRIDLTELIDNENSSAEEVFFGSASEEHVEEDLNFFFPLEKTFAVIKPNAVSKKDELIDRIKKAGFHIAMEKETVLNADLVSMIYQNQSNSEFYGSLQDFMCSGASLLLVLSKRNAVNDWRNLVGPVCPKEAKEIAPQCLRAIFGEDILANAVHGCSSREKATQLIDSIFSEGSNDCDNRD